MPTSPAKHAAYIRKKYHEDAAYRAKHRQLVKKNKEKNRERMRVILDAAKANGCQLCPEREPCCMSFHHVNPAEKRFGVADSGSRQPSPENFIAEFSQVHLRLRKLSPQDSRRHHRATERCAPSRLGLMRPSRPPTGLRTAFGRVADLRVELSNSGL